MAKSMFITSKDNSIKVGFIAPGYGDNNTTDKNYTSIRIEVKGCRTKQSNLSSWQKTVNNESIYYGNEYYLPEQLSTRCMLLEFVNGKAFKTKLKRHVDAKNSFETKEAKEVIFDKLMIKLNHLIIESFTSLYTLFQA